MSRVTSDQNQWGAGDLNGVPSSVKTNETSHTKRYGPLGIAGVAGAVKTYGSEHRVVYELSGDEILAEDGTPLTEALRVELPKDILVTGIDVTVHAGFAVGATVDIDMFSQAVAGTGDAVKLALANGVDLAVAGYSAVTPTATGAGLQTFEKGGALVIDFTGAVAHATNEAGGVAEVVVSYRSV